MFLKSFAQKVIHRKCTNTGNTVDVINKTVQCGYWKNVQRQYCNEKYKTVESESASVITMKKTLKLAGVESTDGISFIKTICPICDLGQGRTTASSIYINKTSGLI